MGAVDEDRDALLPAQPDHVARRQDLAGKVRDLGELDHLGPRGDRGRDLLRDDHAIRIAIDQHRGRAHREDRAHRRDEGVRLRDDLVTGADPGGAQRQLER